MSIIFLGSIREDFWRNGFLEESDKSRFVGRLKAKRSALCGGFGDSLLDGVTQSGI